MRDGKAMQQERELLEGEGFASEAVVRLLPKRPWYRADGTLVGVLPVDAYHTARFRDKGWTLSPSPAPGPREAHFLNFEPPAGMEPVVEPTDTEEN